MISDAGVRAPTAACLYVYVADVDATWQRAVDAGAQPVEPPSNTPYGDRRGIVHGSLGQHLADRHAPGLVLMPDKTPTQQLAGFPRQI